jgi:hypothetical protein
MAANLIRAGNELRVHDLDPSRHEELVELGAEPAASPSDVAARCPLVMTSLPGPAEVEQVLLGPDGILEGARPGAIHVDLSTNLLSTARRRAEAAAERGVTMLDAPVSGGVPRAREGTLAVMVGGDAGAFERCRPLFEAIGDHVFHIGESGQGALTFEGVSGGLGGRVAPLDAASLALVSDTSGSLGFAACGTWAVEPGAYTLLVKGLKSRAPTRCRCTGTSCPRAGVWAAGDAGWWRSSRGCRRGR